MNGYIIPVVFSDNESNSLHFILRRQWVVLFGENCTGPRQAVESPYQLHIWKRDASDQVWPHFQLLPYTCHTMSVSRQRIIIQVRCYDISWITRFYFFLQVFRKYSHSLGPEELDFLEDVLDRHEISDNDVENSIELIAKEYNKQDGKSEITLDPTHNVIWPMQIRREYESCIPHSKARVR